MHGKAPLSYIDVFVVSSGETDIKKRMQGLRSATIMSQSDDGVALD